MSMFTIAVATVSTASRRLRGTGNTQDARLTVNGLSRASAERSRGCGNQTSSDAGQDENGDWPEQRARTLNSNGC